MTIACTITNRTQDDDSPDEYGNPTAAVSTAHELCWYHQGAAGGQSIGSASEQTGVAEVELERWTFYLFPASTVQATSTLTVPDGSFEVSGPPWPARHPRTGALEFVVASAVRAG